jgi:hypothetical protein
MLWSFMSVVRRKLAIASLNVLSHTYFFTREFWPKTTWLSPFAAFTFPWLKTKLDFHFDTI